MIAPTPVATPITSADSAAQVVAVPTPPSIPPAPPSIRRRPSDAPTTPVASSSGALYETKVAGVTFDGRQQIVAQLRYGERVILFREPKNPYDAHAVRVERSNGQTIGYLPRELAASLAQPIRAHAQPVEGEVIGLTGGHFSEAKLGVTIQFRLLGGQRASVSSPRSTHTNRSQPSVDRLTERCESCGQPCGTKYPVNDQYGQHSGYFCKRCYDITMAPDADDMSDPGFSGDDDGIYYD